MCGLLVFGLSAEPLPQVFRHQDKLHHVLGFAVFACSLRFAFPAMSLVRTFMVGLVVAIAIEAVQHWLPGRTSSLGDMAANVAGLLLGVWLTKAPALLVEAPAANAAADESQMPDQGN